MTDINFIKMANDKDLLTAYKELASAESTAKNKYIVFMLVLVHMIQAGESIDDGIKAVRQLLKEGLGDKKYALRKGDISDKITIAKSFVQLEDSVIVNTLQNYSVKVLRQAAREDKTPEEVTQEKQATTQEKQEKQEKQATTQATTQEKQEKQATAQATDSAADDISKEWDTARAAVDKVLDVQPLKLTSAELQSLVDDLTKTVQNWSKVIALRVADAERAKVKKAA